MNIALAIYLFIIWWLIGFAGNYYWVCYIDNYKIKGFNTILFLASSCCGVFIYLGYWFMNRKEYTFFGTKKEEDAW